MTDLTSGWPKNYADLGMVCHCATADKDEEDVNDEMDDLHKRAWCIIYDHEMSYDEILATERHEPDHFVSHVIYWMESGCDKGHFRFEYGADQWMLLSLLRFGPYVMNGEVWHKVASVMCDRIEDGLARLVIWIDEEYDPPN